MKLITFAVAFVVGVATAARLDNTYLPPGGAQSSGGNGNLLSTPFSGPNGNGFNGGHASPAINNHPLGNGGQPSPQYGPPSVLANGGFSVGPQPNSEYGAPGLSGPTRSGINGKNGGPVIGNGFHGGVQPAPEFSRLNGKNGALSGPVIGNGGGFGNGSPVTRNGQLPAPVYGAPSGNGDVQVGEYRNQGYTGRVSAPVNILRYDNENNGDGRYSFAYETENHISQEETGELANAGRADESTVVRGTYSYAGPDGRTYTVNYLADENGFQPTGEHIHPAIQAAAAEAARSSVPDASSAGYAYANQGSPNGNGGYKY